ncbi:hypothetical protein QJQ45_025341 [Haematococcus lacustris]|nr:hypothetical protein QJQ45_025341 [Haematococcus lacustris]
MPHNEIALRYELVNLQIAISRVALDVKLENVVLQPVANVPLPVVHLADFGLSEQLDARGLCVARGGTPAYVAPELLQPPQAGTGHHAYDGKKVTMQG